jgi:hypothetical protein
MPTRSLRGMSVDALLKLREDINKTLDRKANELRSQLSMLGRPTIQRGSRLKGKKVPPTLKRTRRLHHGSYLLRSYSQHLLPLNIIRSAPSRQSTYFQMKCNHSTIKLCRLMVV